MPDLNLRNPDVTAALETDRRVWLEDMGVDGFRIDAAKHLIEDGPRRRVNTPETKAWLPGFRAASEARPGRARPARSGTPPQIGATTSRDGALDMTFAFGIGRAMASGVQGDLRRCCRSSRSSGRYRSGGARTFLTNHDQDRGHDQLGGDTPAATGRRGAADRRRACHSCTTARSSAWAARKPDERIRTP